MHTVLEDIDAPDILVKMFNSNRTSLTTASLLPSYLAQLTVDQLEKFQEIYAEDSLMFGYSPDYIRSVRHEWKLRHTYKENEEGDSDR